MNQLLNCKFLFQTNFLFKTKKKKFIFFFFVFKINKTFKKFQLTSKLFQTILLLKELAWRAYLNRNSEEIVILKKNLTKINSLIKNHINFQIESLIDIAVYDVPSSLFRFTFSYLVTSLKFNSRIIIVCKTNELQPVNSIMHIYPSACWVEREVWDLFGIFFFNHQDLRRILTDYSFEGHPLRKDFPLSGYTDVFYDDKYKKIIHVPTELTQELRIFTVNNSWK